MQTPHPRRFVVACLLAWSAPAAAQNIAGLNGSPCAFATIQDAINAVAVGVPTDVIVEPGAYAETLFIIDKDVVIVPAEVGTNCQDEDPSERIEINPGMTGGGEPAMLVIEADVELYSVDLRNGRALWHTGGNLDIHENANVELHDCTIEGGSSTDGGGGIAVNVWDLQIVYPDTPISTNRAVILYNTTVDGNSAPEGGAVYLGLDASMTLYDGSVIGGPSGNFATNDGGAVFILDASSTLTLGTEMGVAGIGFVDPLFYFVTTSRGDYRIDSGSSAYDRCPTGPGSDLDGLGRFTNVRYDAGAFEVVP